MHWSYCSLVLNYRYYQSEDVWCRRLNKRTPLGYDLTELLSHDHCFLRLCKYVGTKIDLLVSRFGWCFCNLQRSDSFHIFSINLIDHCYYYVIWSHIWGSCYEDVHYLILWNPYQSIVKSKELLYTQDSWLIIFGDHCPNLGVTLAKEFNCL